MIDPQRLTARDSTPFESRLLNAARNESIPTEMKLRMSQGLNLGASALGGAGTTAALSLNTIALVVLGAAALLGLAGVVVKQGKETSSAPATAAPPAPARAAILEAPSVQPAPSPLAAEPTRPALPTQAAARGHSRASSNDLSTSATRNRDADLREEIALLDAVRTALTAGAPHKAMDLLGQYARRYPNGTFVPEALALRVEALTDAGDSELAGTLARRFLKAHPGSPLAERVERLAGRGR